MSMSHNSVEAFKNAHDVDVQTINLSGDNNSRTNTQHITMSNNNKYFGATHSNPVFNVNAAADGSPTVIHYSPGSSLFPSCPPAVQQAYQPGNGTSPGANSQLVDDSLSFLFGRGGRTEPEPRGPPSPSPSQLQASDEPDGECAAGSYTHDARYDSEDPQDHHDSSKHGSSAPPPPVRDQSYFGSGSTNSSSTSQRQEDSRSHRSLNFETSSSTPVKSSEFHPEQFEDANEAKPSPELTNGLRRESTASNEGDWQIGFVPEEAATPRSIATPAAERAPSSTPEPAPLTELAVAERSSPPPPPPQVIDELQHDHDRLAEVAGTPTGSGLSHPSGSSTRASERGSETVKEKSKRRSSWIFRLFRRISGNPSSESKEYSESVSGRNEEGSRRKSKRVSFSRFWKK